jgi:spore maturation protein CgeB
MQNRLRILYLGANDGTSAHRAKALSRLGHDIEILDPWDFLPTGRVARRALYKLVYEIGAAALEQYVQSRLFGAIGRRTYSIVWVGQGELMGPSTIARLKNHASLVINYNIDDPFGNRDKRRFSLYRKAVPAYDLVVVVRAENVMEANIAGARKVLRVFRSADEVAHAPLPLTPEDEARWASDASFIGTWMPERGPIIAKLLALGVPLKIYGDRWRKAKEWPVLKSSWAGPTLERDNYVKAIQCAKVCIGLLSKGNRDLHTTRSVEIPYIGSVLCAERTFEHEDMYEEGKEAVFWSTAEECAEKIFWLLNNPEARLRIAKDGRERCKKNGMLNEVVMQVILEDVVC